MLKCFAAAVALVSIPLGGFVYYQNNQSKKVEGLLTGDSVTDQKCQEAFKIAKDLWIAESGIKALGLVTDRCKSLAATELENAADARASKDRQNHFPLLEAIYQDICDAHLREGNCEHAKEIVLTKSGQYVWNSQISAIIEKCSSLSLTVQELLANRMSTYHHERKPNEPNSQNMAYYRLAERYAAKNQCQPARQIAEKICRHNQAEEKLFSDALALITACENMEIKK